MATNALILTIQVDGEDLSGTDVISLGLDKFLKASKSLQEMEKFIARGNKNTKLTVIRNVPDIKSIEIQPDGKAVELWNYCVNFIDKQEIGCPEAIMQRDGILDELPDFVEGICDRVGYFGSEED